VSKVSALLMRARGSHDRATLPGGGQVRPARLGTTQGGRFTRVRIAAKRGSVLGASDGLRGVNLAGSRSTWRNSNADVT
jgi:hypothetical protein